MSDPSLVQISFKIKPEMPYDMKKFIRFLFSLSTISSTAGLCSRIPLNVCSTMQSIRNGGSTENYYRVHYDSSNHSKTGEYILNNNVYEMNYFRCLTKK